MTELRSVDPRTLVPNPNNPRRTPVPAAMDAQMIASIKAIGVLEPPRVKDIDGTLHIVFGNRRAKNAIAADLATIDVLVDDVDDKADGMRSLSENLIRASMGSVDIWRATEALEAQGWNEQAIADALALPPRTIRKLKLLAHIHPAMLDVMAAGSMPSEHHLRIIANAPREAQAEAWKKHKPKKGRETQWWDLASSLTKRHMPASVARFGDGLAQAYGIVWEDDLFAPAGEDGRYTTNVEGFFGAQQEWLANNLPERGRVLPIGHYGNVQLPKKAEEVYGKPSKTDHIGHWIDLQTGEVRTIAYRLPEPKPTTKAGKRLATDQADETTITPTREDQRSHQVAPSTRPDLNATGHAIIGDLRTDALHEGLAKASIPDATLLGLLVLALGADNVSIDSNSADGRGLRREHGAAITEGGVLTTDLDAIRAAARAVLASTLSCRVGRTNSGVAARIAGDAIGASLHLPTMATETFLSCLSRGALERLASAESVCVGPRVKDTRAAIVSRFKEDTFIVPAARFALTADEIAASRNAARWTRFADADGTGATPDPDDASDQVDRDSNHEVHDGSEEASANDLDDTPELDADTDTATDTDTDTAIADDELANQDDPSADEKVVVGDTGIDDDLHESWSVDHDDDAFAIAAE